MYTRSQVAFLLTCEKLFEIYPRMYFWTITSVKPMCDWQYPIAWNRFSKGLQNKVFVVGVRVLEEHADHGLHYHLLVNERLGCEWVRRLARASGFGWRGQKPRVHVERANAKTAKYLAKYLGKQRGRIHGLHRWGMIGGFRGVRQNDIEVRSPEVDLYRKLRGGRDWSWSQGRILFGLCKSHYEIILDNYAEICQNLCRDAKETVSCVTAVLERYRHKVSKLQRCNTHRERKMHEETTAGSGSIGRP